MSRRLVLGFVAGCSALALIAGCGRAVPDEVRVVAADLPSLADRADGPADSITDYGATDEAAPSVTGASGIARPSAAAGGKDPGSSPGSSTADKPAGTSAGDTPVGEVAKKASEKAGDGALSAVERIIATHPVFGGTAACTPATLSEVAIGSVSTLSGVLGEVLSPARTALQTFVAAQNACGGLNGHRIKLYTDDDQGDPATASAKAQDLIVRKKILAFVGNVQVLTIDAVVPVVKRHKIPIIGGDLASNTWFTNPLLFPQGPPPASVAYGYLKGLTEYFKKNVIGDIYCVEVPRGCEQNDRALKELAPEFGVTVKKSLQGSITAPSYVQQCLEFKGAEVDAVALLMDAASMVRMARSCEQVGFFPKVLPTALGVGNEKQFLTGNKWLGDAYIALNFFPWFAKETPAQRYWHAAMQKYNPGMSLGTTASAGWTAGALLVAAGAYLSPTDPTTADLLKGLYEFRGQKWTGLGGLAGPRTFAEGKTPVVPYCLFAAISNEANTGWARAVAKPQCTKVIAPSDPQNKS